MAEKKFSSLVKVRREALNFSQQELAEKCGLTRANIMHIEAENQRVFLHQALKIAAALDITMEEIKTVFDSIESSNAGQLNFDF